MSQARRLTALAIWVAASLACVLVILRTHFVADFSAFLPSAPNARQQLLVEQLRDGIVARLMLVGIEGADTAERARLSRELAAALRQDPAFVGVQNGEAGTQARDQTYFFDNRYLLGADVTRARFSAEGLREAIGNALDALSGNAGLLVKKLIPRDPTLETLGLVEQLAGDTAAQPRSLEGVWASRDGQRAVLLVQTRAAGSDIDAQESAMQAVRQTFARLQGQAAAQAEPARLLLTGAGVFSVSSRETIRSEVTRLAGVSTLLVVGFLLAVYRSILLLGLGLVPVVSGALAGIATVSLGFGQVHGLTLGFGTTLIGEAVDYSIYLFIQRAGSKDSGAFWRTIRLGVLTSIAGFVALLYSGFPGLAQLGAYSVSGLVAAALVTRFVLPELMPARLALRDLTALAVVLERAATQLARWRWLLAALLVCATGFLLSKGDAVWNRQLSALNPVPQADQQLDLAMRADMNAPDAQYMVAFTAADAETALQAADRVGAVLTRLSAEGLIGGFTSPAAMLPSIATQRARQAALPDEATLRANLAVALRDLPIRPERLEGFVADVQAARSRAPLTRTDLDGTSSALAVDSLLVRRAHDVLVLLPLRAPASGPIDAAGVSSALTQPGLPTTTFIDLSAESASLYGGYLQEAAWLAGLGCLAILALLLLYLRSLPRTLRIAAPLAAAVLCVAAALVLSGHPLTILHLVGLLLIVAIGSNYALFFDSRSAASDATERRQTLLSLVVANLTTVSSFGVLAASSVPVLSNIGASVAPGAFLALLFSAVLASRAAPVHA